MTKPKAYSKSAPPPLVRIIPNAITITALCTGLTSIRFALSERWEVAVSLILIAAILDALDGRVARFLRVIVLSELNLTLSPISSVLEWLPLS